ncbi:hypothetical protein ACTG9Q_27585 [Actinokineospora sp. 24-640]
MTSFDINNNGYLEVNEQLLMQVRITGDIIEELNNVLKHSAAAVDSSATLPWLEAQAGWNEAYRQMSQKLNASTLSSINVADIFNQGDRQGARVMYS